LVTASGDRSVAVPSEGRRGDTPVARAASEVDCIVWLSDSAKVYR